MYSDFFDQIDAARNGRRGVGGGRAAEVIPEVPPLVSFKAGKVKLIEKPSIEEDTAITGLASYQCEADTSRGEVRLVWNTSDRKIHWQWYDRRNKKVVDKYVITEPGMSTFERVDLSYSKKHKNDRIYVWTKKDTSASTADDIKYSYDMYWMQDISDEKDDEIVAQVNQFLADPDSAAPDTSTSVNIASDINAGGLNLGSIMSPSNAAMAGNRPTLPANNMTGSTNNQVDALSSILENLGMPQASSSMDVSAAAAVGSGDATIPAGSSTSNATTGASKQLTLADLQGAMAMIQANQDQGSSLLPPGPPLNELITPEAIAAVLQGDAGARQRLIALLPEGQQSEEYLEENLRSPQVQQTLRTLTQALLPDSDTGDLSGYASIIANFSLDPVAGQNSLTAGNPIQAFLDCIIASVEKEEENKQKEDGDAAAVETTADDNETNPTMTDDDAKNDSNKEME